MLEVTEAAVEALIRQHGRDGRAVVRLELRKGGCAGTKYAIRADEAADGADEVFRSGGLRVLCDAATLAVVAGLRIDHVEALVGGGLRFENPNARRTCACGESFRPADRGPDPARGTDVRPGGPIFPTI